LVNVGPYHKKIQQLKSELQSEYSKVFDFQPKKERQGKISRGLTLANNHTPIKNDASVSYGLHGG
jgi:hypothetical protein